jgi:hypothetical protein
MGYPAQQCVELEFHVIMKAEPDKPARGTRLYDDEQSIVEKSNGGKSHNPRKTNTHAGDDGDMGLPDISDKQDAKKTDFDDFFESLRDR